MKNLRRVLSFVIITLLACCGMLFGCGDKYANLKITTDLQNNSITLYLGEDTETETFSVAEFVATVSGAGEDVSTKVKYRFSKENLVLVEKTQQDESTTFVITAINTGSTTMTILTEEGNKQVKVNINIEKRLESLTANTSYKPYVLAGGETILDTPNAIKYTPADTTQKAVEYSMVGDYAGVTVEPNGRIVASNEAQSGTFSIIATSKQNSTITSEEIQVVVFKNITEADVVLKVNDQEQDLILSTELYKEECSKILTVEVNTQEQYIVEAQCISSVSDLVLIEKVSENSFDLTGVTAGKGKIQISIVLTSGGETYSGTTLVVEKAIEVKQYATNVAINDISTPYSAPVYDVYQNQLGKELKIVVGEENSNDKRFVVAVSEEYLSKIEIVNSNNQIVRLYSQNGEFDVFNNHTTLFVKVKQGYQIDGNSDQAVLTVYAYGTLNLLGEPIQNTITLNLRHGVTALNVENELIDNNVMMLADVTDTLKVSIVSSEHTNYINAKANSNNIKISDVSYIQNANLQDNKYVFEFVVDCLTEGMASVDFTADNGMTTRVSVVVFKQINAFSVTSQTALENNFVGEIKYNNSVLTYDNQLSTATSLSEISIAHGGYVKLSVNPLYFDGHRTSNINSNYVTVKFSESEYLTISENATVVAQKLTTEPITLTVNMSVYTKEGKIDLPSQQISVVVYTAIKSVELNSNYVELLTEEDLGEFDKDKSKWTFEVVVNPTSVQIDASELTWSISGSNKDNIELKNNVVVAKNLPAIADDGSAVVTGIFTQYGRTFILQATIKIVRAVRVQNIYNLTYQKDGVTTNISKQFVEIPTDSDSDVTTASEEYYLYLDSRNGIGENSKFTISQTVYPSNAYNQQIIYATQNASSSENLPVLSITEDGEVTVNRAGTAYIYLYASDSATSDTEFAISRRIYVKVADGLSSLTSLEISSASDLASINNNVASFNKFYQITKDINLSNYISKNGWTPIGIIDGQVYEFNGNINGKVITKGEVYINTISGLKLNETTSQKDALSGLIAKISSSAEVKNLNLVVESINLIFTANDNQSKTTFGALSAVNYGLVQNVSVNITNSLITDSSFNTNIGAIVGINNGSVIGCYSDGELNIQKRDSLSSSVTNIGGIVALNNGTINGQSELVNNAEFDDDYNSFVEINSYYINASTNEPTYFDYIGNISLGGVVGTNNNYVANSSFAGKIKGYKNIGGVVGTNNANIYNAFASGYVNGYQNVGGVVGSNLNNATIEFSAFNMFDENSADYTGSITPNIIAHFGDVGGLVGYAQNSTIKNSYVKTYYVRTTENYIGDIYVTNGTSYANIGGLVGKSNNANISASFAEVKLHAEINSNVYAGGLIGYAQSTNISDSYSASTIISTGSNGKMFGYIADNNSVLTNSYSIVSDNYATGFAGYVAEDCSLTINNSYYLSSNSSDNNAKTETELKNIDTYADWSISSDIKSGMLWFISDANNNGYPLLVINRTTLGVEAPNQISVVINENYSGIEKLDNSTLILWRNTNSNSIRLQTNGSLQGIFSSIDVLPQYAGKAYTVQSSNESILKVTGRNKNYVQPVANGEVLLTFTSKLNNSVSTTIKIYVHNILEKFEITNLDQNSITSLVKEKKAIYFESANATNYKLKIQTTEQDKTKSQYLFINDQKLDNIVVMDMTDKIYIQSTVAMQDIVVTITPFVTINGIEYQGQAENITYSSSYGLKDFVVSTNNISLSQGDSANITYTATGDDLRINDLQIPELVITNENLSMTLVRTTAFDGENVVTDFSQSKVTKIVYEYKIVAPTDNFGNFVIGAQFSLTQAYMAQTTAQTITNVVVTKHTLKNIGLDFYTDCQVSLTEDDTYQYTVNEMSSNRIVAGKTGMLRISLYPQKSEVKQVKVYAQSNGYNFNMIQVVRHQDIENNIVSYLERKPYAIAVNNGLGLILYQESNYVLDAQNNASYQFDGNLYVNCIIPSNVPEPTIFMVYVEVLLEDDSVLVDSIELQSEIASGLKLNYQFANQILSEKIYVAKNVESEVTLEITKIDIEELSNGQGIKDLTINATNGVTLNYKGYQSVGGTHYVKYSFTPAEDIENFTISASMSKVVNEQYSTFNSNKLIVKPKDFIINSIDIENGANGDVLNLATNNETTLKVVLNCTYDAENTETTSQISEIQNSISQNLKTWFAKKSISGNYEYLEAISYENYRIVINSNNIMLQPTKASSGEVIYAIVGINYDSDTISQYESEQNVNTNSQVGLIKSAEGSFYQVLRTNITTKFYNDASATNSIPVGNVTDEVTGATDQQNTQVGEVSFVEMVAGTNSTMYYRLKENIILDNHTPLSLINTQFDGNGYTITINSFSDEAIQSGNLGLFASIDANSMVSNVTVKYENMSFDFSSISDLNTINFGGISAINSGIIYNANVANLANSGIISITTQNNSESTLQVYAGGLVAQNDGYISYSQSSCKISLNRGYLGGLVAQNSNKISNSKVVFEGTQNQLENLSTTELLTKTGGFVAINRGEIYGSYVAGITQTSGRSSEVISAYTSVGGFANENNGLISNCYSNVTIVCQTRSSGFVYNNTATIQSCYSMSTLEEYNSAHNPFTGVGESGLNNSGTISDCYYITDNYGSTLLEPATKLTSLSNKSSFANFVFSTDNSSLDGTWIMGTYAPELIDANLTIYSKQTYMGLQDNANGQGQYYHWIFDTSSASYGEIKDSKYNFRTISNFTELQNVLVQENNSDNFVLISDIEASDYVTPNSATITFSGKLFGNNMEIRNIYLRAENENENCAFGFFKEIDAGIIKDLSLSVNQCVANNISYVGVLAGRILNKSYLSNINIDANGVVVQGKHFVGGLAGYVQNSVVKALNVSASVNAGYRGTETEATLFSAIADSHNYQFSYAGVITGLLLDTDDTIQTQIISANVTGNNKSIGYFASAGVGLVGTGAKLSLVNVELDAEQYVRAYYVSGGVVAENRGTIEKCWIAHEQAVQNNIDKANSTANRNLAFFAGSTRVIGGLVGFNNGGTISDSYSKVDVIADSLSTYVAGGLVGTIISGTIQNCYATGSVVSYRIMGGLVGSITVKESICQSTDTITNTSSIFSVNNDTQIQNGNVTIKSCLATNKWLSSQYDVISSALQKGLLIGAENQVMSNEGEAQSTRTVTVQDCYVNTQITQNTIRVAETTKIGYIKNNNTLIVFKGAEITASTEEFDSYLSVVEELGFGGITQNFDGTYSGDQSDNPYKSCISCTYNDTPITFYLINNYDANMFAMLVYEVGTITERENNPWQLQTKQTGALYPTIVQNINA